ncbi:ABC transporter ATP-binding protein [Promethearchaeum syntrophicum]|uniref:ABC transporter ATP-binding protein n=1 Tax=Promethearchaeum syntrophicum TaxID=2594042 RepID=A0A5B9DA65_9ARCH|nr:ABC transporter ATP-binding protein [Candidatus Prometheoarchaeum syntrophicum]QEE15737.1 putative ABC transporter ATP-binding protein [Candidatus Prometheoarchaeum syntrophicum]
MVKKRIIKYAVPYLPMIFLAIVLLFAQANLDLSLPDYLSDIVDTGIQQQGIESTVPLGIRETEMHKLELFMTPEEETLIKGNYSLITNTSQNYEEYLEEYPILVNESIYVLSNASKSDIEGLEPAMAELMTVVFSLNQIYNATQHNVTIDTGMDLGFDLTMFPTESSFYQFLEFVVDPANRTVMREGIVENFSALGETMLNQIAIVAVIAEYEAIGVDIDNIELMFILKSGGIMLLFTLLSVIATVTVGFLAAKTSAGMAQKIRADVFEQVENFSSAEFDSFSTASLITRSTNDVTQIQMMVFIIVRMVFYAPIMGIGGVIRALDKASSMWWIVGIAVLLLILLILTVFIVAFPKFKIVQKLIDRLNLVSRENLSGMMVIRAFNMQKNEEERFENANRDLTKVSLFINRIMVIMMPMMMLIMNVLTLAIIWYGSHEVADGTMQVGDMIAFLQYAMQIVMAFLMVTMMFIILPRASVSVERIKEVLNTEPSIKDIQNPKQFASPFEGKIEFRDVSFRYPNAEKDILHNISFTAHPGQMTAFIGATGSGKSTIVNLIPRFYEASKGSILIDGINIQEVTQHDLREKLGYVPQKNTLFSGTIESNLLYANENATQEELKNAIITAQAAEFVFAKDQGMSLAISQGGTNVSGGQKQRLSIARALLEQPPIYIFDDSFSALDFKTDAALRRALKQTTGNSTLLIVTQRVSTVMNAEQIIVLDEGRIIGKGTHEQLLETCETYKEIAVSQLALEGLS